MHCNLRHPDAAQSLSALISSPLPSLNLLSLSDAVLERFYCLYVTLRCDLGLWPSDLDIDLWPWTSVVCRLCRSETICKIWAQSDNPRRSYCSLNFDLMTLNMYHVLRYALRYFTQSLNSVNLSVHEIWRFYHTNTSCYAMTLTFDPLTLKVCGRSDGTWSSSVLNLIEIEQLPAELFTISQIFARVTSRCDPDLWPLDLELF